MGGLQRLDCFDRRSGRSLASSTGPASGLTVADPHRVLTAAGTSVEVWRPVGSLRDHLSPRVTPATDLGATTA